MTTKYTPGPWEAINSPFTREDGTKAVFWDIREVGGRYLIAIPPIHFAAEEHKRIALLAAAAPELVEALRNLCDGVANGSVGTEFLTARALLAKIDVEQA
jgi:hypothetical protein